MHDLPAMRRWYAESLRLRGLVTRNLSVIDAFAAVPREHFLGPGPWSVLSEYDFEKPFTTPDDAPHWLCHDVLVVIDRARGLNNGMPSFWAHKLDQLDLQGGERVLQVGAGTGYYAAVLAEIVGPDGRVTAVEYEPELAERARANLRPWSQAEVVGGDGRTHDAGEVDAIVVFAGSTHPAPLWLDRLAEGGRLIMPLTGDNRWGFMLRALRRGDRFDAAAIGGVGIYPCAGGRDDAASRRLTQAMTMRFGQAAGNPPIRALHRGEPGAADTGRVWYQAPGFWLEYRPPADAIMVDAAAPPIARQSS
jgi:protein-L-isoaspartate(D-aspartate) O-methyltransferase